MSQPILEYSWNDRDWKKMLETPEDLLLTRMISTMANYLSKVSMEILKVDGYEKKILDEISDLVNDKTWEAEILKECDPKLLQKFRNIPNQNIGMKMYRPLLKKLANLEHTPKYFQILKRDFLKAIDNNDTKKMNFLDYLLLKRSLAHFSFKALSVIYDDNFSKAYFSYLEKKIKKELFNKSFNPLIESDFEFLLKNILRRKMPNSNSQKRLLERLYHIDLRWEYDTESLINQIRDFSKINRAIQKVDFQGKNQKKKIRKILTDSKYHPFFKKIISKIVEMLSSHVIYYLGEDYSKRISKLSQRQFSRTVSDTLTNMFTINPNNRNLHRYFYQSSQATSFAFHTIISNYLQKQSQKYFKFIKTQLIKDYSNFIHKNLKNQEKKIVSNEIQLMPNKWKFFQFLVDFIQSCNSKYFFKIFSQIKKIKIKSFIQSNKRLFKEKHFASLISHLSQIKMNFLPTMNKAASKFVIRSCFNKLNEKEKKYRVFALVGGIDCNGKQFAIDNIHFFDARKFYFGEGMKFDRFPGSPISIPEQFRTNTEIYFSMKYKGRPIEQKRNSGRAYVDVLARDPFSAIEIAKAEIRKSFDKLVFASTSRNDPGFRPQLPIDFVYIKEGSGFIGHTAGPRENDFEILNIDENYEKITKFYDEVSKNPPKWFERLSKSMNWYNNAQWAQGPHARFIAQWIALEQLILKRINVNNPQTYHLREVIPKLTVLWQKGFRGFSIGVYFRGIEKKLNSKTKLVRFLDSNPKFKGWRENRLIIIKHINLIEPVTRGETKRCVNQIQQEFKKYRRGFEESVKKEREDIMFKIAVLITKRNDIIHEGSTFSRETELLSRELKKILVDVLDVHLRHKSATTLGKLIKFANMPVYV